MPTEDKDVKIDNEVSEDKDVKIDNKVGEDKDSIEESNNKAEKDKKAEKKAETQDAKDKDQDASKGKSLADEMKEAVQVKDEKHEDSETEDIFFFIPKKKEEKYTIWSLDMWFRDKFSDHSFFFVIFLELFVVSLIFFLPCVFWLYYEWDNIDFSTYFDSPGKFKGTQEDVFRIGLFTLCWYSFDVFVSIIVENIVPIMTSVLYTLQLSESEFSWCMVMVFYTSRTYFRISLDCFFIVFLLINMFVPYTQPSNFNIFELNVVMALIIWLGVYTSMLFIMKIVINILIYNIRRDSFKDIILSLNYKIFFFKKLKAISEATDESFICREMVPGYDPGFYLKEKSLFTSSDQVEVVIQNIMTSLGKKFLDYEDIKKYFPHDYKIVFKYLTNTDPINKSQRINVKALTIIAKNLYKKRKDMNRTLNDRDIVFQKLEVIFFLIVSYLAAIVLCILFNINYKLYLFGFGTTIMTFSWIFADTIKKVFNCFVFVLAVRPYVIGDRVKIYDDLYVVYKIDLLNTTFLNHNNAVVYIPNDLLINTKISNIARSPPQAIIVEVAVSIETTYSKAKLVENLVNNSLKGITKHFINAELVKKTINKAYYKVNIVQNLQDITLTTIRQEKLVHVFERALATADVKYMNSFEFSIV